mmetsp:Transcript_26534/g.71092  ORF Transcript_26534/g.71092 Transcript_26534/m.71092 type:complete len:100 (-) Transcript_26534:229-528(-)
MRSLSLTRHSTLDTHRLANMREAPNTPTPTRPEPALFRSTDDLPPTYRRTWHRTTNTEQLIKVLGIGLGLTVVTGGSFAAGFLFSLGKVSELSTSDESS